MTQILEKRTYDAVQYDFDCSRLLATGEVITSITSVTCDQSASLVFGSPVVNGSPVIYQDGRTVGISQVIQVEISGGVIPQGSDSMGLGVPNLLCTVRAKFTTSLSPNQIDATVLLLLKDQPI